MSETPFLRTVALALRAGRRARGMSQRELARHCGLSPATIARLEVSTPHVGLAPVLAALAVFGLRLAVVDEDGSPWASSVLPLDTLGVLDRGGRQFPAHLPEDVDRDHHYWRAWRDEQAGYRDRGPWTYRHWRPDSPSGWQRWHDDLWGDDLWGNDQWGNDQAAGATPPGVPAADPDAF